MPRLVARKPQKPKKKCERCMGTAVPGERFCGACKRKMMIEMSRRGYLTPTE